MSFGTAIVDLTTGLEALNYKRSAINFTLLREGDNVYDKSFTFGVMSDGSAIAASYTVDHSLGGSFVQLFIGYSLAAQNYTDALLAAWNDWETVLKPFIIKDFAPSEPNDKFLYSGVTLQPAIGEGKQEYLILTIPLQYIGETDL